MTSQKITVRVVTRPEANASRVGEAHSWDGCCWRNSVDSCDSDGNGRVFIDCDDAEAADFLCEQLDQDGRVVSYSRE